MHGAEEGWYLTQLDLELKHTTGADITAASIDAYKCFDQLARPLVATLARAAGIPTNVLLAYEAFQECRVVTYAVPAAMPDEMCRQL